MLQAVSLQSQEHAAEIIAKAYLNAPFGDKTTQLLPFGIK